MPDHTRRDLLASVGAAVVGAGTLAGVASAAKDFAYLTPVYTTSDLNVREGPSTGEPVVKTATEATGGRVFEGPESNDGYDWWKVQFSGCPNGGPATGWVADDWLARADLACPMTGTVTSTYWDCRPLGSCDRYHRAVDVADGGGTPVHAALGGRAEHRYDDGGYGNWLVIHHDNGWKTGYGHLSAFEVADGATVQRGDVVAREGDTGVGSGAHLDFQVYDPDWAKMECGYREDDRVVQGTGVPTSFW